MGHWNIRLVKHTCKRWRESADAKDGDECFELQEVFYDVPGSKGDYLHGGVCLSGNSLEEMARVCSSPARARSR